MYLLHLVRYQNLIIVALTQSLIYYRLIRPALQQAGVQPVFDHDRFALLAGVTMLITAFGYIINDISDYPIDRINRPERLVLERHVSFQTAYWLTFLTGFTGFLLAVYLAFYVSRTHLLALYPVAIGGLYCYSRYFKRQPLIGNLLIAAYCAGAAAVIWLAEQPALAELGRRQPEAALRIWSFLLWYLVFAFLVTAFRELIKDMEDVEGDRAANCRTAPILWGEQRSRWLAMSLGGSLLLFLTGHGVLFHRQFGAPAMVYLALTVAAPLLFALFGLWSARNGQTYRRISQLVKLIIVTGLLLMLFVKA